MKRTIILTVVLTFSFLLFSTSSESIEKKFKLNVKVDKKRDLTIYMSKSVPVRSRIFTYILKNNKDNSYSLRLRIAYFADSMLFIKRYIFYADREEFVLHVRNKLQIQDIRKPNLPGEFTDSSGAGICEYYDVPMTPQEIEIMKKITVSKKVIMRYDGTKGFKRVKVFKREKKSIKQVLDAFEAFTLLYK